MGLGTENSGSVDSVWPTEQISTGKTVQMIATMAMNLPSTDEDSKTTLIVVPAALLEQVRLLLHHCSFGLQLLLCPTVEG